MLRKRKIIVYIATSADGFIARADGSVDWLNRPSPKGNYGMGAFYKSIDTILWGRKTCNMALDSQKKGGPGRPSIQTLRTMSSHAVQCNRQRPRAWSS
jgi:dihydrofolate reductase